MLKAGSLSLTVLLALLTALGPLSTDMYLPSVPAIGRALHTDAAGVQLTLSIFLVGLGVGQVVYGPLSDRLGRKRLLLAGLSAYTIASFLSAVAPSIGTLVAIRFVQALGAAGPIVLARAIVRDMFEGDAAARQLSRMSSIMALVPAVGPAIGGVLEVAFGWRANFVFAGLFGIAGLLWALLALPETNRQPVASRFSGLAIIRDFRSILVTPGFALLLALIGVNYSGIFAFISGSSFVLQDHIGLGEVAYGIAFGVCAASYATGTVISRQLMRVRTSPQIIRIGAVLMGAGGAAMLAGHAVLPHAALAIVVPMMIYMIGIGIAGPLIVAAALMPFPDRAGAASSLIGIYQMCFAAIVGAIVGHFIAATPWALVIALALIGATVMLLEWLISRRRSA